MKNIVGLYKNFDDAGQVVRALHDAGFEPDQINLIANDKNGQFARDLQVEKGQKQDVSGGAAKGAGAGAVIGGLGGLLVGLGALAIPGIGPVIAAGPIATTLAGAGAGAAAGGVVGALADLGVPEEHAKVYAEGIKQGGVLVTVLTDDSRTHEATRILNRFNPVDIRQEGMLQKIRAAHPEGEKTHQEQKEQPVPVTGQPDTTIPVMEEDLKVGKRQVDEGGVRVESNVKEEPVEKDIDLHQEHIKVERTPVDRPATDADRSAFKEGTFEMHETSEEPVVEKTSRVTEEIHIDKDVEDETRTVKDTVRKSDVNVTPIGRDWDIYDQKFHREFDTRFAHGERKYEDYQPAYRYGFDLANNDQYRGYDWNRLEPIARQDWERRGLQGRWEDVKGAIREAWESVTKG